MATQQKSLTNYTFDKKYNNLLPLWQDSSFPSTVFEKIFKKYYSDTIDYIPIPNHAFDLYNYNTGYQDSLIFTQNVINKLNKFISFSHKNDEFASKLGLDSSIKLSAIFTGFQDCKCRNFINDVEFPFLTALGLPQDTPLDSSLLKHLYSSKKNPQKTENLFKKALSNTFNEKINHLDSTLPNINEKKSVIFTSFVREMCLTNIEDNCVQLNELNSCILPQNRKFKKDFETGIILVTPENKLEVPKIEYRIVKKKNGAYATVPYQLKSIKFYSTLSEYQNNNYKNCSNTDQPLDIFQKDTRIEFQKHKKDTHDLHR